MAEKNTDKQDNKENIRQPIITIAGHVDHGKTSILDKIRQTSIAENEAGNITQKISFTELPQENIKQRAGTILEKFNIPLEIPGFLFIDTPGHAAFTNLRKRGGSLADLAVLVIDINEGIKPQTSEVLKLLKANKTPFIIALNKIDNISGWKTSESGYIFESLSKGAQSEHVKRDFEEKLYTIIGALDSYDFEADLYTNIKDFTKKIALVPCSAETGEGMSEILAMLSALSQRFLKQRIAVKDKTAKGVVLEVKKEKAINYLESIIYDGKLNINDELAISSLSSEGKQKTITTKIRCMEKALPLNKGYKPEKNVKAAAGLRLQTTTKEEIMPGMPFQTFETQQELETIKQQFSEEISEEINTDETGVVVKAESLGSLEALLTLLRQHNINVIKASIGDITKKDIYTANSLPEEDRAILGFNVSLTEDAKSSEDLNNVKMILNPVVYKIIEDFQEFKQEKLKQIERRKLENLSPISKIKILDFVFRNTNPAIFGIKVERGKISQNLELINNKDEKIGRIKTMQEEKNTLQEAEKGKEIAISVPGVNFQRQLEIGQTLYSNLSESQFREFKQNKDLLTEDEKKILMEIANIKRKHNSTWGI